MRAERAQAKRELRLLQVVFWSLSTIATVRLGGAAYFWLEYDDPIPEHLNAWLGLVWVAMAIETLRVFLIRLAAQIEALRSEREQR